MFDYRNVIYPMSPPLTEAVDVDANERRLTSIRIFRACGWTFRGNRPEVPKDMTMMVSRLTTGRDGLPLEIYRCTNITVWTEYEVIQVNIFDHLLAVVREFGLRLYQKPAGSDLAGLAAAGVNR